MNLSTRFLNNDKRRGLFWLGTAVLLTALFFINSKTAFAHTRVEVGPYTIIVGWVIEPPIVGERNALSIEILEGEEGVAEAEADLKAELVYGGQTFRTNLDPTEEAGFYTATIFPTIRGQYAVRLFGSLNGMEIDEVIEPEEVFSADRLQFPEPLPDSRDLQKQITALETELQSARNFTYIAIIIGVFGIIIALVAVLKNRK